TAMRRALRVQDRLVQGAIATMALALMIWFGLTMVWPLLTGAPIGLLSGFYAAPSDLVDIRPYAEARQSPVLRTGLGAFLTGAIAILILSVVAFSLLYERLRGRLSV
ncbi:MAG: hypothetical protein AAGK26_15075, partial [Pseudomonadota bacterium]